MDFCFVLLLEEGEKDEDGKEEIGCERSLEESLKNSQRFTALAKPNIGVGFHRLYKGFKNISQLFGEFYFSFQK